MKKEICILSNGLARGGTDTFVINLVKGLDKTKYNITLVLSIDPNEASERKIEVLNMGVNVLETCSVNKGLSGKIRHLRKLFVILKKGKYDIFQCNIDLFNGPNLFIAWLAGIPIRICHSHNSMQEKELRKGKTISILIYQFIMRQLCWRFSNRRCGCSVDALDFLFGRHWKKDSKAIVVNNGIDIEEFKKTINIEQKRKKLGIKENNIIITVGRISSQKNPILIANVFVEVCKKRRDCELVWVGSGNMEKEVQQIIKLNKLEDKVHFLGTRSDVNELLICSNLFFFPSIFEGLGIVIIEAQAAGLPCLISSTIPKAVNCGGCDVLDLNKKAEEWAIRINDILDGKIKLEVDSNMLQKYSVEYMVKQMESLFI